MQGHLTSVSERKDIITARDIYRFSELFQNEIGKLENDFGSWRESRGDGNCYYRSLATSLLEHFCRPTTSLDQLGYFMERMCRDQIFEPYIQKIDYRPYRVYESITQLYRTKQSNPHILRDSLEQLLLDRTFDLGMVCLMRNIAINYLTAYKDHPEIEPLYEILYDGTRDMITELGVEAEGLTFLCLAEALGLSINHVILSNTTPYSSQMFKPSYKGVFPQLYIWFRTGHYDILYSKAQVLVDAGYSQDQESLYYTSGVVNLSDVAYKYLSFTKILMNQPKIVIWDDQQSQTINMQIKCISQALTNVLNQARVDPSMAYSTVGLSESEGKCLDTLIGTYREVNAVCNKCRGNTKGFLHSCKHICIDCINQQVKEFNRAWCQICRMFLDLKQVVKWCPFCKQLKQVEIFKLNSQVCEECC